MNRLSILLLLIGCSEFDLHATPDPSGKTSTEEGTTPEGPQLEITPLSYDFGAGHPDCPESIRLSLRNVGTDTLHIDTLSFDGDQMALGAHEIPVSLEPGTQSFAEVIYTPTMPGAGWGWLDVMSDDPRGTQTADQRGDTSLESLRVDEFEIPENPPVDLLFAVDQSNSMEDDQLLLAAAFDEFIAGISAVTSDWQLGVVTLDTGCFNHGILTPDTPDYAQRFREAVSWDAGLTELSEALIQLSSISVLESDGGCNNGFLREDAPLHIIVVSDEREQSGNPEGFLETIIDAKSPGVAKVSAVVDVDYVCGDPPPEGGPFGYDVAATRTGGLLLDICSDLWGSQADDLAAASFPTSSEFELSTAPQEDTIQVFVDGTERFDGWLYEADRNVVRIESIREVRFVTVQYEPISPCL